MAVDSSFDRSMLSPVNLDAGTVQELTPPDLNMVDMVGKGADDVIVLFAYHSSPDGIRSVADLQDPRDRGRPRAGRRSAGALRTGFQSWLRMQPGDVRRSRWPRRARETVAGARRLGGRSLLIPRLGDHAPGCLGTDRLARALRARFARF